eukprot:7110399-Prymnesium_polylepis.1
MPLLTKLTDVSGFTPIDASKAPWSMHLKPCLKKLSDWSLNVFSPDDVNAWLVTKPLAQRVEILAANSRQSMAARLKDIERQDKAMASKQGAVFESKLTALLSAINSLPPQ